MQVLPHGLYCKRVKSKQTNKQNRTKQTKQTNKQTNQQNKIKQNKQTTSNNYESELGTPILRRSILIID